MLHCSLLLLLLHVFCCCCRSLHRCRRLAAHTDLVQLQAQRVFLSDDTACNGCGRLIGSRVFDRYPSGVLVCGRCSGAVAAASGAEGAAADASPVEGEWGH
jgi:hypothetical protein